MSFESEFVSKLQDLKDTQDSIVSLSKWVLQQNNPKGSSLIWASHLKTSTNKLNNLYLLNDIVQHAKKFRLYEFLTEFKTVIPSSLKISYDEANTTVKGKIARLLKLWEDRKVYSSDEIQQFAKALTEESSIRSELKQINELYNNLDQLNKISNNNLTQFSIQTKNSNNINEKKLVIIERLAITSKKNVTDTKSVKIEIKQQLENLILSLDNSLKEDDNKINIIDSKLNALKNVDEDDDDDELPMYEQDEEEEEEEEENTRKRPSDEPIEKINKKPTLEDKENESSKQEVKEEPKEQGSDVMSLLSKLS
ncbi:unnamed protein product [Candida verbasci]|uniref:CID domain-containing protein n=1 Tax=Candida verbasci TaxID=1227364 RepID=A0A9W4TTY0_9ASCO|nr:unnamed protein product [Candida verbasci]